ncbi:MAG TPA: 1-acyl-sn-glycerol-3-phosphate acyltransferase [Treponemataceae bacterium]|nr:1-acyl-sn-glycerol-3-phosphate acyltransferase [Treponemataceae bacterium]
MSSTPNPNALVVKYRHLFPELIKHSRAETIITEENVYQPANMEIRKIMESMCVDNLLPNSEFRGRDHIADFLAKVKEGKRGIILMEHFSNFDLPGFIYLLERSCPEGKELADRVVAIAGMKLSEDNKYVSAFAEAYSRVIIYPSRSLAAIKDPEQFEKEEKRSRVINLASMRALDRVRKEGKVALVFPAGTRYRPGKPETRKGVREIDSYIRLSDVMLLVSINGNCLRFSEDPTDMLGDVVYQDRVIMTASPAMDCKEFRAKALEGGSADAEDKKQIVVDTVMDKLLAMHEENEKGRL